MPALRNDVWLGMMASPNVWHRFAKRTDAVLTPVM